MTVQFEITRSRNCKSLPSSPNKWNSQVKYCCGCLSGVDLT